MFRHLSYIHFFFVFSLILAVYYSLFGIVDPDEVEGLHTAWRMSGGESIYGELFQHHHPLFYYALIPIIKIGGETLVSFYLAEGFAFAVLGATVYLTFLIAEKVYENRTISLISLIFLLSFPYFIPKASEVRPDIFQVVFGLLSFYLFLGFLKGGTVRHLVLSALFLSVSFLSLQKAVFLIAVVGLAQLYYVLAGKMSKKNFFLYWAVFFAPFLMYMGFLFLDGRISNYFDFAYLINLNVPDGFSPLRYFPLTLKRKLLITLSMACFIILLFRGCLVKNHLHLLSALTGGGLLASVFLAQTPHTQYFLMSAPFVAVAAAGSLCKFFSSSTIRAGVVFFSLVSAVSLIGGAEDGRHRHNRLSAIEYVLSVTGPEDRVMGYWGNLFRRDAEFFWFCGSPGRCVDAYQTFREYEFTPALTVRKQLPRVVDTRSGELRQSFIQSLWFDNHYRQSPQHEFIYVRKR